MNNKVVCLFLILSLFQFSSAYAGVEDGVVAYKQGDYEVAYSEFEAPAEAGNPVAQYHLGMMFIGGLGVEQKPQLGIKWLTKAASQGGAEAQFELGNAHRKYSEGNDKNYEPLRWYRSSAALGHVEAGLEYGKLLLSKETSEHDKKAFAQFLVLAEDGEGRAQRYVAFMYESGRGVSKDLTQAAHWVQKSAEQKMPWAVGRLGSYYYFGRGVEKDTAKALYWFEVGAGMGEPISHYLLGVMYVKGDRVVQDYEKAEDHLLKAAELGLSKAYYALGVLFYQGKGVKKDYGKAIGFIERAAKEGDANAQYLYGVMHYIPRGVDRHLGKAVHWIKKSAEAGVVSAQYAMGYINYTGKGRVDYTEAYKWFYISAANGSANGKRALQSDRNMMMTNDRNKGKRLADEWLAQHRK